MTDAIEINGWADPSVFSPAKELCYMLCRKASDRLPQLWALYHTLETWVSLQFVEVSSLKVTVLQQKPTKGEKRVSCDTFYSRWQWNLYDVMKVSFWTASEHGQCPTFTFQEHQQPWGSSLSPTQSSFHPTSTYHMYVKIVVLVICNHHQGLCRLTFKL